MSHTIPKKGGGGPLLSEAEEKDLVYWLDRKRADLANSRFPDRDQEWIAAAEAELRARGVEPSRAPKSDPGQRPAPAQRAPQQTAAIAQHREQNLVSATSARDINQRIEDFARECHLVAPATSCASLPEGCEVAFSVVHVDPNPDNGDVSPVGGGKFSLSANVLKKFGAAAGVSWDMNQSGRLDDGREPLYCHYRAVGLVRHFDGSTRVISGEVELDLRDGSPQVEAMKARTRGNVESQIRDTRLFLLRHAETKAKSRAIADMGIRRSYTASELKKPFAIAKLMWTGRSEDPELRRIFAEKMADAHMASVRGLYGGPPAAPPRSSIAALPERAPERHVEQLPVRIGHGAPPVGVVRPEDDFEFDQPYGEDFPQ